MPKSTSIGLSSETKQELEKRKQGGESYEDVIVRLAGIRIGDGLSAYLQNLMNEKEGFKFGEPWRFSEKSLGVVVPILREKPITRHYRTYPEMAGSKYEYELMISDSGEIGSVQMTNGSPLDVFIRVGTMLKGETQERAVTVSIVAEAKTPKMGIPVKCIHASRGINCSAIMSYSGLAPSKVTSALFKGDQGQVWSSVNNFTGRSSFDSRGVRPSWMHPSHQPQHDARRARESYPQYGEDLTANDTSRDYDALTDWLSSSGDDLVEFMDTHYAKSIEEILKQVPIMENQVGIVIFDHKGILGLESFDSPKSWDALHKDIAKKYGETLAEQEKEALFDLKPDVIPKQISQFIKRMEEAASKETTVAQGERFATFHIEGEDLVGEYTTFDGEIIHILAMRNT